MPRFAEFRQAMRSLRRTPGFTLAAILTIAVGVGTNTAVYHVIYSVLIEPLPFREPARLVQVWETTPAFPQLQVTAPDFEDWRKQTRSFESISAYTFQAMNQITLLGQGEPEIVHGSMVTHDLFSTMGISPLLGRNFTAEEERQKQNVAIISEKLWRRKFAADPSLIGKPIRLETRLFTVIGIVPARQAFPEWVDVWLPMSGLEPELQNRRKYHPLEVIARLKPGSDESSAQADIQQAARRLAQDYPDTNGNVGGRVIPLATEINGDVKPALLLAWSAVGLVFLIACANLAHLLLARMSGRERELAIRSSLGAGCGQLVKLVLTESLLLGLMGGAVGTVLAAWSSRTIETFAQGQIPRMQATVFQAPVWMFAIAVSLVCGLLFGLPACWQVWSVGSIRRGFSRTSQFGPVLIAGEIALAFLVLTGAALLLRSFVGLLNENPGYRTKNILAIEVPLPSSRYNWDRASVLLDTQLLSAIRALPGVEAVAAANCAPMSLSPSEHSRYATRFGIEGRTFEPGKYPVAQSRWVTPDYFHVLSIPLKRGQWLEQRDRGKPRYLINEALARQYFPNEDPTARRLLMGVVDPHPAPIEIAGVVGDVRELGLDEIPPPTLYMISTSPVMTLLVRTSTDPSRLAGAISETIHRADPEIAVRQVRTLDRILADSLAQRRFALLLLATFALLALLLTAAGIYGLLSYSISRRTRELGIRAAVGASPAGLMRLVLREAAVVTTSGLAAGLLLSVAFTRVMKTIVYQLSTLDPWSYLSAGLLLFAIAFLSTWLPATRAANVDPAAAIREP